VTRVGPITIAYFRQWYNNTQYSTEEFWNSWTPSYRESYDLSITVSMMRIA